MLPKPIWLEGDKVFLIDQTKLPVELDVQEIVTEEQMWDAIKRLVVRGAPAIGLAGAFGVYLGAARKLEAGILTRDNFIEEVKQTGAYLDSSRPTAVNLHWAVTRMGVVAEQLAESETDIAAMVQGLLKECEAMLAEDIAACRAIGEYGADLLEQIPGFEAMLTHCNAGALATSMYGTALAPAYIMQERQNKIAVYSDETRPLLQGARLTAWELSQSGIPVTTICDNMAGVVMAQKKVQAVIVGADRIASNGDTANKIGTYTVAILAKEHGIPFYVAAPLSTVDFAITDGTQIPIEQRKEEEIRQFNNRQTVPDAADIFNPAFDVTPEKYITAIITEKGVAFPPFQQNLEALRKGEPALHCDGRALQMQVVQAAKNMAKDGLSSGSFGNVSAVDRAHNLLAITPSGVLYDTMQPEDICLLQLDGSAVEGVANRYKPSSELPMHCAVYKARPDCNAIMHTHSAYCTAYASSGKQLGPVIGEMGMIAPGAVPLVAYQQPGSQALADKTAEALQNANGCLLANHGAVTVSDTMERAYLLAQILEDGARAAILAAQLGTVQEIPAADSAALYEKMKGYGR
ncbi:MAG: S-methyl-5-thioribose-1-phosphate isomerase [Peptococcaceae bacterium]|nr:S-methyl-5-thioribose-1-phosphate isomerase [Peptococcaceae bacterium]